MDHPRNPYIAGLPLREGSGFFGRQDTVEWVARELVNENNSSLVLHGQRRIGKTSLLLQLERILPSDALLPVYLDLQYKASTPLGQVLAELANKTAKKAGLSSFTLDASNNQGLFFRDRFLPQLCERLGDNRRPVFLLDEFDVLDGVIAKMMPEMAASRALFRFLREVMDTDSRPAFIFAVGRQPGDLSQDYKTVFKTSLTRPIWVLDRESAEALIRQGEANETLNFTEEAVVRILSLTSGHPYLTQLLCQRLWERAYRGDPAAPPSVDVPDVNAAVPDALAAGASALHWVWDGLELVTQFSAAVLADTFGEGEVLPEDRIVSLLEEQAARVGVQVSDSARLAPLELVKRNILEPVREGEHRFAVELFRLWVRMYEPLRKIKAEMETKPAAEMLFSVGQQHLSQERWDKAIQFLKLALEEDSAYLPARVHLGETLLRTGQTKEAVAELEQAYVVNNDEARYPLALALVIRAQELEALDQAQADDEALRICERVLEVLPGDHKAQEIRTSIWARQAVAHERAGRWDQAAKIYQRLLEEAEEEELRDEWDAELQRVRARPRPEPWAVDYLLDDRYRIVKFLADMRRSRIYLAEELQPPRHMVVVKRLKLDHLKSEDSSRRFEREVIALRQIHHQNVLSLYDSKTVGEDRYFVTEYADKGTLKEYLETMPGQKLRPMEALGIALAVCQGLEAAHQQGIIHRDVKPGNVFLFSQRDGSVAAKLGDFSIAHIPEDLRSDETLTEAGTFIGTPAYASPEQFGEDTADPRSDLYSWATVFFQMLTGESPTDSLRDPDRYCEPMSELPLSFFVKERGIPCELAGVLHRNLCRDRSLRYQSATQVREALQTIRSEVVERIRQHLSSGEAHMRSFKWQEACDELDLAKALCAWYGDPDESPGCAGELASRLRVDRLYAQGMVHSDTAQWRTAIEYLAPLLERVHSEPLIERLAAGELSDVVEQLSEVSLQEEGLFSPKEKLSKFYERLGDRAFARLRFQRAIKYWQGGIIAQRELEEYRRTT